MGVADLRAALAETDNRIIGRTTDELMEQWDVSEKQLRKITAEFGVYQRPSRLWSYPAGTDAKSSSIERPAPRRRETRSAERVPDPASQPASDPSSPPAADFNPLEI